MHKPKATDFALDIAADLHKWRSFVAIGELGSLTRAALFLDSNQSFLSRQVNALERECGARLFNRTGRGVELSETGQRLFNHDRARSNNLRRPEKRSSGPQHYAEHHDQRTIQEMHGSVAQNLLAGDQKQEPERG